MKPTSKTICDAGKIKASSAEDVLARINRRALAHVKTQKLEEKHRQGYLRQPATAEEFSVWEKGQKW